MINEDAVAGNAEYARKLNAGELDHTPAFTTGQVNKNGTVVPLPVKTIWDSDGADGEALLICPPPTQGKPDKGPLSLTSDIIAYENGELEYPEIVELFQGLVNTGLAWQLQGHYGRVATEMLEAGLITKP